MGHRAPGQAALNPARNVDSGKRSCPALRIELFSKGERVRGAQANCDYNQQKVSTCIA